MGIILNLLIVLACIIALLLILAILIPKHYTVTVSETVNVSKHQVFQYLSILKNQTIYSEWLKSDTGLDVTISGIDGTKGAIMRWESNNKDLGCGEQEIINMDNDSMDIELRFIKPVAGVCRLRYAFVSIGENRTEYSCYFAAYARFPVNLPAYLLGRRFIRKNQQKTLSNIKEILHESLN